MSYVVKVVPYKAPSRFYYLSPNGKTSTKTIKKAKRFATYEEAQNACIKLDFWGRFLLYGEINKIDIIRVVGGGGCDV